MKFILHFTVLALCLLCTSHTIQARRSKKNNQELITTVSHESFDSIIKDSKLPVVLNVSAEWCSHSTAMDPVFTQAATNNKKTIRFAKISVDNFTHEDPSIAYLKRAYNLEIECVPTFIIIVNNKVVGKLEEQMNAQTFKESITRIIQKSQHAS